MCSSRVVYTAESYVTIYIIYMYNNIYSIMFFLIQYVRALAPQRGRRGAAAGPQRGRIFRRSTAAAGALPQSPCGSRVCWRTSSIKSHKFKILILINNNNCNDKRTCMPCDYIIPVTIFKASCNSI